MAKTWSNHQLQCPFLYSLLLWESKAPIFVPLKLRRKNTGSDQAALEAFYTLYFMIDLRLCWLLSILHSRKPLQKTIVLEIDFNPTLFPGFKQLRRIPANLSYNSPLPVTREEAQINSIALCLLHETPGPNCPTFKILSKNGRECLFSFKALFVWLAARLFFLLSFIL